MTTLADSWDLEVELPLLAAAQTPSTARQLQALTGLSVDTVASQLHVLRAEKLVVQLAGAGLRYQITGAGRVRLSTLTQIKQPLPSAA